MSEIPKIIVMIFKASHVFVGLGKMRVIKKLFRSMSVPELMRGRTQKKALPMLVASGLSQGFMPPAKIIPQHDNRWAGSFSKLTPIISFQSSPPLKESRRGGAFEWEFGWIKRGIL